MKLAKMCVAYAAAGVLLAFASQSANAAGEIQITKVNPEGRDVKTRTMRIQNAGRTMPVVVDRTPVLTNADISDVRAVTERTKVTSGARPETREVAALRVRFTPEGAARFNAFAKEWQGRQIALIIDNKVVATPVLTSAGTNGELIFSGTFTPDESQSLAANINNHKLPPIAEGPKTRQPKQKR
jgi:preprotein translocase subunit SecD